MTTTDGINWSTPTLDNNLILESTSDYWVYIAWDGSKFVEDKD